MAPAPTDPQMFPELPGDLSEEFVSDEDLAALLAEFRAVARAIREDHDQGTTEIVGDRSPAEIADEMQAGVEAIEAIEAAQATRAELAANFTAEMAELAARAGLEAETPEDPDDPETPAEPEEPTDPEAVVDPAAEPVAASAGRVRRPLPANRRHRPQPNAEPEGAALIASSAVYPHAEPGERLTGRRLAEVFCDVVNKKKISPKHSVTVASVTWDYPEDRQLGRNGALNMETIGQAVPGFNSLTASGGLCAPLTPIYDMPDIETASRPVRDALAGFRADRGGVIVPANPVLTDYADAVGIVTADQDAAGGTSAVKNCMRIECPEFSEVQVDSIYRCVEIGNLTGKAYPELLQRVDTLVMANWARAAETNLLDGIRANSTIVTGVSGAGAGAVWEFFGHVIAAGAGFRSRHRMATNATLDALLPEWVVDELQLDMLRQPFRDVEARSVVETALGRAGIRPTFYKDGPSTNTGQVFGAQAAGNLLAFPVDVQWAIFPPGTHLFLDSGSLDLGIVRDSTLNSTNDYQVFAESWEQTALVGVESLWITSTICPNGTQSAAKDFSAYCTFS